MSGLESVEVARVQGLSAIIIKGGRRLPANVYHALELVIFFFASPQPLFKIHCMKMRNARDDMIFISHNTKLLYHFKAVNMDASPSIQVSPLDTWINKSIKMNPDFYTSMD
jgi:hypothetical protein